MTLCLIGRFFRRAQPIFLLFPYLLLIFRLLLIGLLGIWLLSLWGYPVAFSDAVINKGLEILLTVLVVFFFWKVIDLFIRNYLKNKELAQADEEDVDSEWGDAPLLDRSQTLLPLVRKFIGITVVVMSIMLILSSLGVNIGPLLAGAGVVGIAIGFGAQKLVSDVLSGIFYLLDDAFRVGEYIEAGSITGAVEKITLSGRWVILFLPSERNSRPSRALILLSAGKPIEGLPRLWRQKGSTMHIAR